MLLINLTSNIIHLVNDKGTVIKEFPPTGIVAKAIFVTTQIDTLFGQPVLINELKGFENLPKPQQGIWYIVDRIVAEHAKRKDVITPYETCLSSANEKHQVVTTRKFIAFG